MCGLLLDLPASNFDVPYPPRTCRQNTLQDIIAMPLPPTESRLPNAHARKRATITRLLVEARRAFAEKGLAGARVDEIARAAGVTKQLVYQYFSSKEQLLDSVLDESAQDVLADLLALELDHLGPTEALRVLMEHLCDQYRSDPTLAALAQESFRLHDQQAHHTNRFTALAPVLVDRVGRLLQRGAATGEFVPGVDARRFCAAAALLITGGFTARYVLATMAGCDTTSAEGAAAWRQYAVDFVLSAVLAGPRPSLGVAPD